MKPHEYFGIRTFYRAVKAPPMFHAECSCGFESRNHGTRKAAIQTLSEHLGRPLDARLKKDIQGLGLARSTVGMEEMFPEA